jgi:hypothetical protein
MANRTLAVTLMRANRNRPIAAIGGLELAHTR